MTTDVRYRNFIITYWMKPVPFRNHDYDFQHIEYDGPEDGRIGSAASFKDARAQIDEMIEEGLA